ncbi:hypothetical protein ACXZ65_37590, partial [Streptomyces aculeolatus]
MRTAIRFQRSHLRRSERTAWRICRDNGWWSVFGKRKGSGKKAIPSTPGRSPALRWPLLQIAVARRGQVAGCVVHSDRGSQGGFNRSSQHLLISEVLDGSSSAG